MKKLLALMAVVLVSAAGLDEDPWVVLVSTSKPRYEVAYKLDGEYFGTAAFPKCTPETKQACYDFVYAMNDANKRRTGAMYTTTNDSPCSYIITTNPPIDCINNKSD